ncbi:MAG: methytransferase partner Trm112 [Methanophagales archaeon]|nr:methytransferase partner Trm112 [Methanophagales archaeon]
MKKELMDILACPVCKGDLELEIEEEDENGEVVRGTLYCRNCDERYPIEDGIPNLLPPELRK